MIYHIALPADWAAALDAGVYQVSSRGITLAEQGFIHCSQRHQVLGVANFIYADLDDLLLLEIDPTGLDVRMEPPAPGAAELFPHIYGPLPLSSVRGVHPFRRDPTGQLTLPD
jgi:uncharacterized protein (DUF952 family)